MDGAGPEFNGGFGMTRMNRLITGR